MDGSRLAARINLLGPWLRRTFGGPVFKIGLDAGLSCPNRDGTLGRGGCLFCPPSGAGGGGRPEPLDRQIAAGLHALERAAARRGKPPAHALAYYQAHTATHAPAQNLRRILAPALAEPRLAGIIVSTRPDCLDAPRWEILEEAARARPLWLELGLQSSHDVTLARINRGHGRAAFERAVEEAERRGLRVAAHVILGLPGEDQGMMLATARRLATLGVWGVKIHGLMVLEGSGLARLWREGGFAPWSREEFLETLSGFLALLPREMLVHRLVGDPGTDRLLAPEWAGDKDGLLTALADLLETRDLEQGCLTRKSS